MTPGGAQAVLFDLDGTLVDTPAGMAEVLTTVVRETGREPDESALRATIGRPLATSLAILLDTASTGDPDVTRAAERARTLFTEQVIPRAPELVFPGVPALLAELRDRGVTLAVVTSKVHSSAVELLDAAGLLGAFDTLSCHGMTPRGKPSPDLALLAAAELKVPAGRCLVVGDAVDDIRMAHRAGMAAYGVGYGVAGHDRLLNAGARAVAGTTTELRDALAMAVAAGRLAAEPHPTGPRRKQG
ncbi:HAD-IA family hydrolase [Streptomyces alkaliphilus]|uniref:HAD-IA family hydrolase n=1 Tax=Streptomyces alkaliphilus TaxID=1472722 RepID=A0A7W3T9L2_9ACTN|nr:HAD family hydrolase [Streptomyces alkaliphilus]MBB0242796.1 HAD-IA family hydrolase [Streptomyces alkaliphilus]